MKDRLTPEQSQRLIELGVDPSKASGFAYLDPYGLDDAIPTGVPLFTLSDMLSLLPKGIMIHRDGDTLGMIYHCGQWRVGYSSREAYCDHTKVSPELIDALFELLVWCITNKHLKV